MGRLRGVAPIGFFQVTALLGPFAVLVVAIHLIDGNRQTCWMSRGQTPKTTRQVHSTTGAIHSVRCGSVRWASSPTGRGPQKMIFEARST